VVEPIGKNMAEDDVKAYSGRWIARIRGRVVAQGGTPEQARRAAQSRYKETMEVVFMPNLYPLVFPSLVDSVRQALPDGLTIYLVGGAVRDALVSHPTHDLDFALAGEAIKTARQVADMLPHIGNGSILKADFYPLDAERDTGRVIVTNEDGTRTVMDFATFRGPDLESDLGGRDFTLNAIALNLRDNSLFDPLGGAMDLKEKRLRACSPSAFMDDPVRILRGIRLAAKYGFQILPETRSAMKEAAGGLEKVSPERLRDELCRILDGPQPAACIRALDMLGALETVLPELSGLKGVEQRPPHVHDVWNHTLAVVSHLETILSILAFE
jgi:poly(A) polymerase